MEQNTNGINDRNGDGDGDDVVVIASVWKSNGTGMGVWYQCGCAGETLSHCCHARMVVGT
ncbi:Uncharacterized protein BM_BM9734 [Brugia malayi]|uniref:Bm9734 n=2 Tax=Brugia TaxID=6278 RepID=A0A0J9YBX3_BRUMA|nr:Uncharacterized protein BM_BM9734 [Brugia malayi]CDQ06244.1 Bm9734 [Brugia malayi]VDO48951.1 unnamed protein product [Brugia timori]VIO97659.1 Uncharacterized protein BM_BM9734 [Brugia malayi]